ncbi:unnamed protein product [Tilletia controversa]|uniref:SURP motif domain-containing protein n=1 Tax=Tilletia controversa TaxID=13291 RepID=A0A8X7MYC6_9BASI|nr:hypothetical protein CF328_g2689 [Tilletia controversa]KAE8253427.1 hypothetical protein A4X06_0g1466 [Tilletia controversa]CAD6928431.1 unnamed protein product [Tilletia controversa]CAD6935189.1 unnamed protein product [Tilletia controversa]CAD6938015.1 unnamed protein product [Tilletia controversa]
MAISLPPPKAATVEDVDEITAASSYSLTNNNAAPAASSSSSRFTSKGGVIVPPPDIRNIVDKVASYVARNGKQFEQQIRSDERGSSARYAFLAPDHPYHAYYQSRIEAVANGEDPQPSAAAGTGSGQANGSAGSPAPLGAGGPLEAEERDEAAEAAGKSDALPPPRPLEFSADMPNVTAIDLDVIKLTALFTARKGRPFATALATREKSSYQFEFLKPSHSLFGFFNALVEQYKLVLDPPPALVEYSHKAAYGQDAPSGSKVRTGAGAGGGRTVTLDEVQKRADWEKSRREKRKKEQDAEAREKAAFDEIDWQDFVVVGTVELTEADQHIDLPPPTSLRTIENMTLAQQRMAAMIMEMEGSDVGDDVEESGDQNGIGASEPGRLTIESSQAPAAEVSTIDQAQTPAAPRTAAPPAMKIRKDYVPKSLAQKQAEAAVTTQCPVCGQLVPTNEMGEHIRVELLNPRYREQRQELEAKKAQHNTLHSGADPMQALHRIAAARTDMFGSARDEETQARREEEERRRAKEKEKIVWDGHTASKSSTKDKVERAGPSLEEQLEHLERKRKEQEAKTLGPQLPVPVGSSLPLPPYMYQGGMPMQHGMPYPPPPMMGAPVSMGMKRPAEDELPGQPALQRLAAENPYGSPQSGTPGLPMPIPTGPRADAPPAGPIQQNTDGSLHSELEWVQDHPDPISLAIILPDAKNVSPECDGRTVVFEDLPIGSTTMGMIRERVQMNCLGGTVGAGRLKLRVRGGRATTQKQTLAYWNLIDGDEVQVSLK